MKFHLFALSALLLAATSCASRPVSAEHNRAPASERQTDCRAVMCAVPAMACVNGEVMVSDPPPPGKCCPGNHRCEKPAHAPAPECARVRCMMKMPKCEDGEEAVDMRAPGACCPQFECNPADDKDDDGVVDSEDRCPTVKGPADNHGCPKPAPDCTRVRCDGRKPKCEQGEDLVDLREPGACCPKWSCEPEGDSNEEL